MIDIGYFGPAVSGLLDAAERAEKKSHLMLFDIGNPFPGNLEKGGRFATHTWDIISLLGAYNDLIPDDIKGGVSECRRSILDYCYSGELRFESWRQNTQSGPLIQYAGVTSLHIIGEWRPKAAEYEGGERGFDLLWENVILFFLQDRQFAL